MSYADACRKKPGPSPAAPRKSSNSEAPLPPYYVFILTNAKTFNILNGNYNGEHKKFVLHSLRLFKEPESSKDSEQTYNEEVDTKYGERFEKISPGLKRNQRGIEHRKHQYLNHGYHLQLHGLDQRKYFEKMIELYNDFKFNQKLSEVANILGLPKSGVPISNQNWKIADIKSHDSILKSKLDGCDPGICYAQDQRGKKFVYEYRLYLDQNFKIVDAPVGFKVEFLPCVLQLEDYDFEIGMNEKA
ncbi:uncharacterized protein LOC110697815 isoform X2 [Chenopodium quinoa]|nr:uncharacterized protein LOC110697815 isoform X2 [Chenopodium quinoa]